MTKNGSRRLRGKEENRGKISLYPLKFNEVIADVLKVKPEPKTEKDRKVLKKTKSAGRRKDSI